MPMRFRCLVTRKPRPLVARVLELTGAGSGPSFPVDDLAAVERDDGSGHEGSDRAEQQRDRCVPEVRFTVLLEAW